MIGSLGDLLAFLGITAPLAAASALGDSVAAVLKTLYRAAASPIGQVLDRLPFGEVFRLVKDLVVVTVQRLIKLGMDLSNDPVGVLGQVLEGTGKLWENFVGFVAYFINHSSSKILLSLGVDEGSVLVGGVVRRGAADLSEEAFVAIKRIGKDLTEASVELSDDAADGLGGAAEVFGEQLTRDIFAFCLTGVAYQGPLFASRVRGLASPIRAVTLCDEALVTFNTLTSQAQTGIGKIKTADYIHRLLVDHPSKAEDLGQILSNLPKIDFNTLLREILDAYDAGISVRPVQDGLIFSGRYDSLGQDFEKRVAKLLSQEGKEILGMGDVGVARMLKIKGYKVDFVSVTDDGTSGKTLFHLLEVKESRGDAGADIPHAIEQLGNTLIMLRGEVTDAEIGSLRVAIPSRSDGKPVKLSGPFSMDPDGTLYKEDDLGRYLAKLDHNGTLISDPNAPEFATGYSIKIVAVDESLIALP